LRGFHHGRKDLMRISKVSYRELRSGPGFSHQAVEMEALLSPDERPGEAMEELRQRVRMELAASEPLHTNEIGPPEEPQTRHAPPPLSNERDKTMQDLVHVFEGAEEEMRRWEGFNERLTDHVKKAVAKEMEDERWEIANEIMGALKNPRPGAVRVLENLADRLGWTPF
jgi:hypothetical protein